MGRGKGAGGTGNIDSLRRKQARRADAARGQRARREKLRAAAQKHTRGFLSPARSAVAKKARELGTEMRVETRGGGGGLLGRGRWAEATVELVTPAVCVWFGAGENGGSSAIDVRLDGRRVSNCPPEIIQSGDRPAFAAWLEDALGAAVDRAPRDS